MFNKKHLYKSGLIYSHVGQLNLKIRALKIDQFVFKGSKNINIQHNDDLHTSSQLYIENIDGILNSGVANKTQITFALKYQWTTIRICDELIDFYLF